MKNDVLPKFPDGFFSKVRKTISNEEAFKDIIPIEWSDDVLSGKKKVIVKMAKNYDSQELPENAIPIEWEEVDND